MKVLNLRRTAVALVAYDIEKAKPMPEDFGQAWAKFKREDDLGEAVGVAYGLDTADRNNFEDCKALIRPGVPMPGHPDESFVRRMAREYGGTKDA